MPFTTVFNTLKSGWNVLTGSSQQQSRLKLGLSVSKNNSTGNPAAAQASLDQPTTSFRFAINYKGKTLYKELTILDQKSNLLLTSQRAFEEIASNFAKILENSQLDLTTTSDIDFDIHSNKLKVHQKSAAQRGMSQDRVSSPVYDEAQTESINDVVAQALKNVVNTAIKKAPTVKWVTHEEAQRLSSRLNHDRSLANHFPHQTLSGNFNQTSYSYNYTEIDPATGRPKIDPTTNQPIIKTRTGKNSCSVNASRALIKMLGNQLNSPTDMDTVLQEGIKAYGDFVDKLPPGSPSAPLLNWGFEVYTNNIAESRDRFLLHPRTSNTRPIKVQRIENQELANFTTLLAPLVEACNNKRKGGSVGAILLIGASNYTVKMTKQSNNNFTIQFHNSHDGTLRTFSNLNTYISWLAHKFRGEPSFDKQLVRDKLSGQGATQQQIDEGVQEQENQHEINTQTAMWIIVGLISQPGNNNSSQGNNNSYTYADNEFNLSPGIANSDSSSVQPGSRRHASSQVGDSSARSSVRNQGHASAGSSPVSSRSAAASPSAAFVPSDVAPPSAASAAAPLAAANGGGDDSARRDSRRPRSAASRSSSSSAQQ